LEDSGPSKQPIDSIEAAQRESAKKSGAPDRQSTLLPAGDRRPRNEHRFAVPVALSTLEALNLQHRHLDAGRIHPQDLPFDVLNRGSYITG
jgi:hypothetical protein